MCILTTDRCEDMPVGLQNRYIIQDMAFSQWNCWEDREPAHRARLHGGWVNFYDMAAMEPSLYYPGGWVHYESPTRVPEFGLEIDLGI